MQIAEAVKALGLDRDQSIDMLLTRLGQFCAEMSEKHAETETPVVAETDNLPVCSQEVGTLAAAKILGISKDTVLKLRGAGVLPYRNAAPPGSTRRTRPIFRFPLDTVLKLRNTYQTEEPAPQAPTDPARRRVRGERKYKHLHLGDD